MLAAINAQIELCALELRGVGADVAVLTPMERLVLDQYKSIAILNNMMAAGKITARTCVDACRARQKNWIQ